MAEKQTPTKRKYKANRKKVSAADNAYNSYSRMWSKLFGKGTKRMSKKTFLEDAKLRGVDRNDGEGLLREARQRVADADRRLTTEQAMRLKETLLTLKPKELEILGMDLEDLKSMTIQAYRWVPTSEKGQAMLSKYYDVLRIARHMKTPEAGAVISAEIYGS